MISLRMRYLWAIKGIECFGENFVSSARQTSNLFSEMCRLWKLRIETEYMVSLRAFLALKIRTFAKVFLSISGKEEDYY